MRFLYIFLLFVSCKIITVNAYLFKIVANDSISSWNFHSGSKSDSSTTIMHDNSTKIFKSTIDFSKLDVSEYWHKTLTGTMRSVTFQFACPDDKAIQVYDFYINQNMHHRKNIAEPFKKFPCPSNDQYIGYVKDLYSYMDVCVKKYCVSQ